MQSIYGAARRILRRSSGTLTLALILAAGIAAIGTVYSVVHQILIRPLPYRDADRLVIVWSSSDSRHFPRMPVTPADLNDWKARARSFDGFAASVSTRFVPSDDPVPSRVAALAVSTNYFSVVGIPVASGRGIESGDSATQVVVVSNGFWQRQLGARADAVGSTVRLDERSFRVIGITSPQLDIGPELWVPTRIPEPVARDENAHLFTVIGRLRAGASIEASQKEMSTIALELAGERPASDRDWGVTVLSLREQFYGSARGPVMTLLGASLFLLAVACVNGAGITAARGAARSHEIAVRAALGASRWEIAHGFAMETAVTVVAATLIGLGLTAACLALLRRFPPVALPRLSTVHLPVSGLLLCGGAAAAAMLVVGLLPALRDSAVSPAAALRTERGGPSRSSHRVQQSLVVVQIALALALSIVAATFVRRLLLLANAPLGLSTSNVATATILLPPASFRGAAAQTEFLRDLTERLENAPKGAAFALADALPAIGAGTSILLFDIAGRPKPAAGEQPTAFVIATTANYFHALSIPLIQGRAFSRQDNAGTAPVAIVDDAFRARFFPTESPIGHLIDLGDSIPRQIVGVANSVRQGAADAEMRPSIYVPLLQNPSGQVNVVMPEAEATRGAAALRSLVQAVNAHAVVLDVATYDDRLAQTRASERTFAAIGGAFAAIALLLVATGMQAMLVLFVRQRRREIAIRMAIGGTPGRIGWSIVSNAATLAVGGILLGLGVGLSAPRLLAAVGIGSGAPSGLDAVAAASALLLVSAAAVSMPVRLAVGTDPNEVLRAS